MCKRKQRHPTSAFSFSFSSLTTNIPTLWVFHSFLSHQISRFELFKHSRRNSQGHSTLLVRNPSSPFPKLPSWLSGITRVMFNSSTMKARIQHKTKLQGKWYSIHPNNSSQQLRCGSPEKDSYNTKFNPNHHLITK